MSRVATSNLGLGTWAQGENPGSGSQTVDNTGLNGNFIKIDTAVGTAHNANGSHKTGVIDKTMLATNVCDGATILKDGTVGLKVPNDGLTGAQLANTTVDGTTLEATSATGAKQFRVKDGGITAAKLAPGAITGAALPYKEYAALVQQTGTNDPTATILVNTLGATPTWTRQAAGLYYLTLAGAFPIAKTLALTTLYGSFYHSAMVQSYSSDVMQFYAYNGAGASADGMLYIYVSIRVYS